MSPPLVPVKSVGVLGGGISGLSAAYHLSQRLPKSIPITLYEASPRTGGWLQSTRVPCKDGGSILFEQGPHTLRPSGLSGLSVLELVKQLELNKKMLLVPKNSAAAKNRYILYQKRLLRAPSDLSSSIRAVLTEPIIRRSFFGLLRMILNLRPKPSGLDDESIASFTGRVVNPEFAYIMIGAIVQGIYAGDIDKLSAKSTFLRPMWERQKLREEGSQAEGLSPEPWPGYLNMLVDISGSLGADIKLSKETSVLSFKDGIESLSKALTEALIKSGRVDMQLSTAVTSIQPGSGGHIMVKTASNEIQTPSHIVSSLPLPVLYDLLHNPPYTLTNPYPSPPPVTVSVVNLYYGQPNLHRPHHGFGYLIPPITPSEENPENALGVIFDSDQIQGQDSTSSPGTKLTVMMGGHYWSHLAPEELPSTERQLQNARDVVSRDLGITIAPDLYKVTLQRNCIPQYEVGYSRKMQVLRGFLDNQFGESRIRLAGSGVGGISVGDCIVSGRRAAVEIAAEAGRHE